MTPFFATLLISLAARAADDAMVVESPTDPVEAAWASSASATVMPVDDRLPMSMTTGSLVDQAPGVRLQSFGDVDSFSGVSIRGSTLRQVLVYVDGIPLNPEGGQAVNLSDWPLRAFSRVEVYRGNTPGRLGGAAVGGAINMVRAPEGIRQTSSASISSHARVSADNLSQFSPRIKGHRHHISAYLSAAVNPGRYTYFTDNGTPYNRIDDQRLDRQNNRSGAFHALIGWRTEVGNGTLDIVDAWMSRGAELPGHINNPARAARIVTRRNLLGMRYTPQWSGHRAHVVAWWLSRTEHYADPLDEIGLGSQDQTQGASSLGLRIHDTFAISRNTSLGLTMGLRRDGASIDEGQPAPPAQTGETLTVELPNTWGRFSVTPTAHGTFLQSQQTLTTASIDPRLGVAYRLHPRVHVRANAGKYLRPPDSMERFGDRGTMIGNPDLTPERGWQWDIGTRAKLEAGENTHWRVDLAHFWVASEDRITWIQNSQRTLKPVNLGKTWTQGIESAIQGQLGRYVQTDTNVTLTRSRNLDPDPAIANNQLPGTPPLSIWHSTALALLDDRVRLTHAIRHIAPNYLDATNWVRTAPRNTQDLTLQGRPNPRWPLIELGVQNLLDTITEVVPQNPLDPSSAPVVQPITDFAGHPLPGRTWTLSLRWNPGENT